MGYDLNNCNDNYFRWNIWGFPPIRFLAEIYGWEPMGTIIEAWYDEDGNSYEESEAWYDSNDGQTVCAEDSMNWAIALEAALKDLTHDGKERSSLRTDAHKQLRQDIWNKDADVLRDYFSNVDSIAYVKEFVVFLKEGSFTIY